MKTTPHLSATRVTGSIYDVLDGATSYRITGGALVRLVEETGRPCDVDARMYRGEDEPARWTIRPGQSVAEAMDAV